MKRTSTLLGTALIALAASPVFAHHWDGNPEMEQSILNDHSSGFVGTSYAAAKPAGLFDGNSDLEQSILNDLTREGYGTREGHGGFVGTSLSTGKPAGPFDGNSDLEQSILNDL